MLLSYQHEWVILLYPSHTTDIQAASLETDSVLDNLEPISAM